MNEINIIALKNVNCYLITFNESYILIDTGYTKNRSQVQEKIEGLGCKPGALKLILITHGDFDHIGNVAYLQKKYGGKVAMHRSDLGMAEHGNMFWNRTGINIILKKLIQIILVLSRLKLKKVDRFTPDIFLEDGDDLSDYGFNARVIHFPGHSKGSIGFITSNGELFCGDLLQNLKKPEEGSLVDNKDEFNASISKLKEIPIKKIYPGHGEPFSIEDYLDEHEKL